MTITKELIKERFDEYNQKYFNGQEAQERVRHRYQYKKHEDRIHQSRVIPKTLGNYSIVDNRQITTCVDNIDK